MLSRTNRNYTAALRIFEEIYSNDFTVTYYFAIILFLAETSLNRNPILKKWTEVLEYRRRCTFSGRDQSWIRKFGRIHRCLYESTSINTWLGWTIHNQASYTTSRLASAPWSNYPYGTGHFFSSLYCFSYKYSSPSFELKTAHRIYFVTVSFICKFVGLWVEDCAVVLFIMNIMRTEYYAGCVRTST